MHVALGILSNNRSNMFSQDAVAYRIARDSGLGRAFSASDYNVIDFSTLKSLLLVSRGVSMFTYYEFVTNGAIGILDFREDLELLKSKLRFIVLKSISVAVQLHMHNLVNYLEALDEDEYLDIMQAIVCYDIDLLRVGVESYNKIKCWDRSSIREIKINYAGFVFSNNFEFDNSQLRQSFGKETKTVSFSDCLESSSGS